MNRLAVKLATAVAVATMSMSGGASAALFRAYLSFNGADSNPCTVQLPCRLLPAALAAVNDGGEIWMVDSANFNTGSVVIAKSVSILAVPGAVGSVLAIGGPAIDIAAGGLKVGLHNLVVAPFPGGGGTHGIRMTGASTLAIENCLIMNLPENGILVDGGGQVRIASTILRHNTGYGVVLQNGASAEISSSQSLANAGGGVLANASTATTTAATVSDSVVAGGAYGFNAEAVGATAKSRLIVTRSTIDNTVYAMKGLSADGGSAMLSLSGSAITSNGSAWNLSGGGTVLRSFANNHFDNNGSAPVGTLTTVSLQ